MDRPFKTRRSPPARGPHRYRLRVDGDDFFPAMVEAIESARERVLLEMYLCSSGALTTRFIDALCLAATRGVEVCVLLDDFGSLALSGSDRGRLLAHGVQLGMYNPLGLKRLHLSLFRDHRKLLAVDGKVAFVGGAGLTDDFDPRFAGDQAWHEVMLEIRGPCVTDWEQLFARTWSRWHAHSLTLPAALAKAPGPADGRVVGNSVMGGRAVMRSVIAAVKKSRRRVWITTAYFVPTLRLRRVLARAARHGVDVRLLVPGPKTDQPAVRHAGRRFYGRLLRAGVRIFEYQPRCLHAKYVICDDWSSVGSSNLDHWTLRWNLEANQVVTAPYTVAELAGLFAGDLAQAREWTLQEWQARGRWHRLMERFFGALDEWLVQLSYMRDVREADKALRRGIHALPTSDHASRAR
ncbi:phospholipase D/transphosphatidylase [Ectothiorhodospira sp. PHS-1]|uniref:phospholipase D-like domain-containing protein n=1 Tax=Ectothiorhodospira sp. PHS-1 TaxID=519989 RepID=UPI00024A82BA|nr:phospholipase D-like domain-containing protein [Ectothiorhodospira sp. PHS-1]EHQ53291.1 phospholipase D/transphosphatidylase [Ectothiorhodospira sp. PHS-1]